MLSGMIAIIPLAITILFVKWVYDFLGNILAVIPFPFAVHPVIAFLIKVIVIVLLVIVLGMLIQNMITRRFLVLGEKILIKVPVLNHVYKNIKQLSKSVFLGNKNAFKKPVLLEYPLKGLYTIGFVTNESITLANKKDLVSILIPTTPMPMSGCLIFAKKKELLPLNMTMEQALKLIVSAGLLHEK